MTRLANLRIIISVLLMASISACTESELTKVVKKIQPAVVTIVTYDKQGKEASQGSGFFIDPNAILVTNYHVLKGADSAKIRTHDGRTYPVRAVVAADRYFDLVKIQADVPGGSPAFINVSKVIPDIDERVVVVSSPVGLAQCVTEGVVSAIREIGYTTKLYQITAPISPGSIGSPVVNMKGEIIGVAAFRLLEGQILKFAVAAEKLLSLKAEKRTKTLQEWSSGNRGTKNQKAEAFYVAGNTYRWLEDHKKAVESFQEAIRQGKFEQATACYKQAIRFNPDDAKAHDCLGMAYYRQGKYEQATACYKEAIRIKPDDAHSHIRLGWAYGKEGKYEQATACYKEAIRIKPDCAKAHYALGLAHVRNRDRSSAMEEHTILLLNIINGAF